MSRRTRTLNLQGWLLLLLLPTLGLLIVGYAVSVYERLQAYVIEGFDAKMTAASTVTAAFIDPTDYQELVEPLPIRGMTHDETKPLMWALDSSRHELLRIRVSDGLAEPSGIKVPAELNNLSNDIGTGQMLLGDSETGRFFRVSLVTNAIAPAFTIAPPIRAIATDTTQGSLYVAGRDLERVDPRTGAATHLAAIPEPIRDLTYDRNDRILWGLAEEGDALLKFDPATGKILQRIPLSFETPADGADAGQIPQVRLRTIAYERISGTLFGSSVSLLRIDPAKGTVSARGFLAGFGREQGPVYRRYAAPMTRILQRTKLTYLYTQLVQGRDRIVYGIDGTVGKDHSPLFSTDTVRAAEVDGMQQVMTEGVIFLSGIELWPPWGLLKSAYTPIFDEHGIPQAMVGADVNASVIQFQIRRALVLTFGLGAVMLILAGVLAYAFARRLTGPLLAIKNAALHAAAGDFGQRATVTRPLELRELAARFGTAASSLGQAIETFQGRLASHKQEQDRQGLIESLERHPALAAPPPGAAWAWGFLGPRPEPGAVSGAVQIGDRALAWIARRGSDSLTAAAGRAETALAAEALLARLAGDPAALGAALRDLFQEGIAAWVFLAPEGMRAHLREPGLLVRLRPDGSSVEASATFDDAVRPGPGERLVVAGPAAPFAALPAPVGTEALLASWRDAAPPSPAFAVILAAP